MSLSSFLLPGADKGKGKAIDKGLDDLFQSSAVAQPARVTTSSNVVPSASVGPSSEKKRKATEDTPSTKAKRSKPDYTATPSSSKAAAKTSKQHPPQDSEDEASPDIEEGGDDEAGSEEDAEDADDDSNVHDSDEDEEGDPSQLVHESLLKSGSSKGQTGHSKAKRVPSEESPAQRDARTLFVGNVAVEVTKSRPSQKQLKRHILSFVPSAKIESVRFRSVAFKKPTAELPTDDGKTKPKPPTKVREHDRTRTASWRGEDKDEAEAAPAKRFLTPQEKKRVAFIKHEIHEQVDAVNAYVVFAHPYSAEELAARPKNLPPPATVMDPYEAARKCAEGCDGSTFLGRTLRVDVVQRGAGPAGEGTGEQVMAGDPKVTIFVGNLDFASKEEDLRAFFEGVVCEERGQPGEAAESDDEESGEEDEVEDNADDTESAKKPRSWVKRVRIVRDRDTQLGKGFAYVQFVDRECVDEILALDQTKLKFAKRKLRVQRCKTLPGGPKLRAARPPRPSASNSAPAHAHGRSPSRPAPPPRLVPAAKHTPKGNPELGAKLAHLPKEERKKAKAADPDRVARRMAKKRSKALAEKGVKARVDRERVRKRPSEKNSGGGKAKEQKQKRRVRSGNAISKLNNKK